MAEKSVPALVRKYVASAPVENAEQKTFTFVASDDSVDRYGDTIDAKGWELDNFTKNPVILLNHRSSDLPIGKAVRTWVDGNKLKAEIKFDDGSVNPDGPRVAKAVQTGLMNALSVGFKPKEFTYADDRVGDGWYTPQNFKRQELLEISVVTVPANPNALLTDKAAPEDVQWLRECATRTLEAIDGAGRWVSKAGERSFATRSVAAPSAPATPDSFSVSDAADLVTAAVQQAVKAAQMKRTGKIS